MHAIRPDIFWTGYIDWNIREFHGYSTPYGSTYNAYLIRDERPALIDTVKDYGFPEMVGRIKNHLDPAAIKYIISNHTEMDHSGAIDRLLGVCPQAEVVCSPKGAEGLSRHFKKKWKMKIVQTGDTLDLGRRQLKFVLTPMVHWPDSMATYDPQERILFPNDAFGQHLASVERYADELGLDRVLQEAAKYYGNIVLPYGSQVLKVLKVISGLAIDTICPSHGLIWRRQEDIQRITGLYKKWATHQTENRVVIVYDTMWHSTETMAQRLYHDLEDAGMPTVLLSLRQTHISDVVTEILSSRFVCFGTPMLNNRMLPTMAALLMYLKGLKPKNRYAVTFGSYGWATAGFKEVEASVREAGFELLGDGTYTRYIPDDDDLAAMKVHVESIKKTTA